jgi:hypothetical protein
MVGAREVISKVLLIEKLTIVLFPAVSVLENCACLKLLQVSVREKQCVCYVVCNVLMQGTNALTALKTKQVCGQPSGILRHIVSQNLSGVPEVRTASVIRVIRVCKAQYPRRLLSLYLPS